MSSNLTYIYTNAVYNYQTDYYLLTLGAYLNQGSADQQLQPQQPVHHLRAHDLLGRRPLRGGRPVRIPLHDGPVPLPLPQLRRQVLLGGRDKVGARLGGLKKTFAS